LVWGYTNYSKKLTIEADGGINAPDIGKVYLRGLTFAKAKSVLTTKCRQFMDLGNSEIEITITHARTISVNIVGEVFKEFITSDSALSIPETATNICP